MMKSMFAGVTFVAAMALTASAANAAGDPEKGKEVFKLCMACHTTDAGKNKVGPSLHAVVGRTAGSIEGFKYSKPMMEKHDAGYVWTPENLIAYINAPKEIVPGGTMAFAGLTKTPKYKDDAAGAAADLVAFLQTQM